MSCRVLNGDLNIADSMKLSTKDSRKNPKSRRACCNEADVRRGDQKYGNGEDCTWKRRGLLEANLENKSYKMHFRQGKGSKTRISVNQPL